MVFRKYSEIHKIMEWAQKWIQYHPDVKTPLTNIGYWAWMYKRNHKISSKWIIKHCISQYKSYHTSGIRII